MWLALVTMWLLLNGTLALADVILGMLIALGGVLGLRVLQNRSRPAGSRTRGWRSVVVAVLQLAWLIPADVVRSNVAVATLALRPYARRRRAGFVEIPLELRHPTALAVLACIITATPGTSWAGYNSRSGVLTMHILDLIDPETWTSTIKERYERRLLEIFE